MFQVAIWEFYVHVLPAFSQLAVILCDCCYWEVVYIFNQNAVFKVLATHAGWCKIAWFRIFGLASLGDEYFELEFNKYCSLKQVRNIVQGMGHSFTKLECILQGSVGWNMHI